MNQVDQRTVSRRDTASPRKPQRKNGREKYEKLLDALEALITEQDSSDISLANLSQVAGVPAASVYHFFPSVDASLTALAERHYKFLSDTLLCHSEFTRLDSWQDLLFQVFERVRAYYEENAGALKVHFGPQSSWALRQLQMENHWLLADTLLKSLSREFELPPSQDWRERFMLAITINDSFWSQSYSRFGRITDEIAAEGKRAASAYLKLYLGELLQRRQRRFVAADAPVY
ncbi:transcriptional regulator, TetR family [Microbulbifer donghaiensis]|uniref:Transcriptional regulator, TetR family n=1 Tax=Microbulbifer donghaiensis TaxID=494016 RepID=A0A1M4Z7S4_9GAMM|nr:TetR/AcrR family transcriptional regulator [Microbulbifer donghaiensis]SHF14045.1 transcriptional regulator, TetR family [Microbulbifer donghaiensis]